MEIALGSLCWPFFTQIGVDLAGFGVVFVGFEICVVRVSLNKFGKNFKSRNGDL